MVVSTKKWNFHPELWGRCTHFEEHIFPTWLVQPPTRKRSAFLCHLVRRDACIPDSLCLGMGQVGMFQIGGLGAMDGMVGYTLAMYKDLRGDHLKNCGDLYGVFPTPNLFLLQKIQVEDPIFLNCTDPCNVRTLPSEK